MGTCYQCGSAVSDAADLCPYCGMAVVPGTVPATVGTVPAGAPQYPLAQQYSHQVQLFESHRDSQFQSSLP